MPFDFASAKALVRRTVADTFGVQAFYVDDSLNAPEEIRVRYHLRKVITQGDIVETGYANVLENIEKVVLYPSDYPTLTFKRGGKVTIPSAGEGALVLALAEQGTNVLDQVWQVVRE